MKKINYTREQIIIALRQFDEGCIGETFDNVSTEELYRRLDDLSDVFTADDLILATELGF